MTNENALEEIQDDAFNDVREALRPYIQGQLLTSEEKYNLITHVSCLTLAIVWAAVEKEDKGKFLEDIGEVLDKAVEIFFK